ncbi:aspartate aminotransferase family protein [Dongia deserti]|uniref:aspartate aminotransferase family protein n=1 Tax=Dongia deserti TaxID=2268030 RepID=UPI0013C3FD04|nr:aspartate aminotransferase family protein [Dongia deserti]
MNHLTHDLPQPAHGEVPDSSLPKIACGRGSRLFDVHGKDYIDGSGGPAVFCLGHAHPEVNEAIKRQLDRVAHGYRYNFTSDPLEELTEIIAGHCGPHFRRMIFTTGGSEAVESALKIALHYHSVNGEPSRRRFIARRRSWHGNTLGALSVSEFKERRDPFEGSLIPVSHLSPVNAYRPPVGVAPADVAQYCAQELEREIVHLGSRNIAAFIFEPVVGAAGGVVPAPAGYARLVRDVCDRHGVLLIADEVMCGAGRCGTWRALAYDGVEPDVMAIAKGLAGGYIPLGATIYHERVSAVLEAKAGGPMTGHTFTGHTLACAAGVAVQRIVARDRLLQRVATDGPQLMQRLRERLGDIEFLGEVRGRGFFIGLEFVADRVSKEPFPASLDLHHRIRMRSLENGLICYPMGGNIDGIAGDTVILAPPYNVSASELDEIIDKLERSVRQALKDISVA